MDNQNFLFEINNQPLKIENQNKFYQTKDKKDDHREQNTIIVDQGKEIKFEYELINHKKSFLILNIIS